MVLLRGRGPGTDFVAWPGIAELVICLCSANDFGFVLSK